MKVVINGCSSVDCWDWITPEVLKEWNLEKLNNSCAKLVADLQNVRKTFEFFEGSKIVTHNPQIAFYAQIKLIESESKRLWDMAKLLKE
jgi:hypothetical protein